MGIVNVTPDSFSDGGQYSNPDKALAQALFLAKQGAHILDLGGVSTRPGALAVSAEEEWQRVHPVLAKIRQHAPSEILLSLDTSSPTVAARAAAEGLIDIINDVAAGLVLEDASPAPWLSTLDVAAEHDLGVVLMHMQGSPQTMQNNPLYKNCVADVCAFLQERAKVAQQKGVAFVALDPGIGFGKTQEHNLDLLSERGLQALVNLNLPVLIGLSRKRFLNSFLSAFATPEACGTLLSQTRVQAQQQQFQQRDLLSKEWEFRCLSWGARIIRSHRMPFEF